MKQVCSLLALLTGLASCVDVIDLDLNTAASSLVIEGKITDGMGPHEVKITQTVDFKNPNEFPPLSDAKVTVQDVTTGQSDTLVQQSPGVYTITRLQGIPGHTYRLVVRVGEQTISANATMPAKVNFDNLSYTTQNRAQRTNILMVATFQDPPAMGNAYRYVNYQNGFQSKAFFVRNDGFTNGNRVSQPINDREITIAKGDTMTVEMQCIEKPVYDYFNGLMQLQANNAAPTNPPGNLTGGALGYFSAHTVQRRTIVIE